MRKMRRLIFGALATAALTLAIAGPAWANHGGDADPPGADIVPENEFFETSAGGYDNDGDLFPIAAQIMRGDGVTTALEFAGPTGEGIDVSRAKDDTIYVCALTIYRLKIRDLEGYDSRGRCSTAAGAMELSAGGISPGGTTFN